MNRARIARAYKKIAEGYAELALSFADDTAGAGGASVSPPARSLAPVDDLPPLPPLEDYDPTPPLYDDRTTKPAGNQHLENVLGQCPNHQKPWTIKPGGVSKAGKPYGAFWKCSEKDESTRSGYCDKRPVKAWEDQHPASAAA
jgi:hypothetical protein